MHYPSTKQRIIRITSFLFVRFGALPAERVDQIIRDKLASRLFSDPSLTPDHIRVGLVEFNLLNRTDDGQSYLINLSEFESKENIEGIFGAGYRVENISSRNHLAKKIEKVASHEGLLTDK